MRKLGKCFFGLTIIGTIISVILYLYSRTISDETIDSSDDFDSDDFDLDSDLDTVVKREFVPLCGKEAPEQSEVSKETN